MAADIARKQKNEVEVILGKVDEVITAASENGLFDGEEAATTARANRLFGDPATNAQFYQDPFLTLETTLEDVRNNLNGQNFNYANCHLKLGTLWKNLSTIENKRKWQWRLKNVYAANVWAYLAGFLLIVVIFYLFQGGKTISKIIGINETAIGACAWGIVGGILRGFWWLWYNINRRSYRRRWQTWFISTPLLGGIFGAIVYFLIVSGTVIVTGQKANTINNQEAILFLAAFAGFNWDWITSLWKSLADSVHKAGSS
ncbi:MAG: hypothetical protein WA667_17820 [Candidatus Nitrosopolaris sp.]